MPTLAEKARMDHGTPAITLVPLDRIDTNPFGFDRPNNEEQAKHIQALADSILKMKREGTTPYGLIHYPQARYPKDGIQCWQIADGYCRLQAFKLLHGKGEVGFEHFPVIMLDLTDDQMAEIAWRENQDRKDIDPIAMARWYKLQLDRFGYTQELLGTKRGISQSAIAHALRILALPEEVLSLIQEGSLSPRHGRELLVMASMPAELLKLANRAVKEKQPVETLRGEIRRALQDKSKLLDKNDKYRGPAFKVDECADCKYSVELDHPWDVGRKEQRCLKPDCWQKKQDAAMKVIEAKKQKEIDKMLADAKKTSELTVDKALKVAEMQTKINPDKSREQSVKDMRKAGTLATPEAVKVEGGTGKAETTAKPADEVPEEKVKAVDLEKLGYSSYQQLDEYSLKELDDPSVCSTCEHKTLGCRGNIVNLVCLDPKCYRRKKTAKTRAANKATKEAEVKRFTGMDLVLQALSEQKKSPLGFRPVLLVIAEQVLTHYSPGRPNKWREDYGLEDRYAHGAASMLEKWLEPLDDAKLANMIARESYLRSGEDAQKTTLEAMKKLVKLPEEPPAAAEEGKVEKKK